MAAHFCVIDCTELSRVLNLSNSISRRKLRRGIMFLLLQLVFLCDSGFSQIERPRAPEFAFSQFRLIPIHPAGRPASMGGAFIGIADDATAAAINPAGLSFLTTPEISLSHCASWQTYDFPVSRRVQSEGEQRQYEPVFDQTLVNVIYPQWGFTFAVFRQVAFRSEFSFDRQQFVTINANRPLSIAEQFGASGNFAGRTSEHYSEVIHNAFVVAKTLQPRVHAGLALRTTQLRLRLDERQYFEPALWLQTQFNAAPDQITPPRVEALYRIDHVHRNQFKASFSLGLLLEITSSLSLGIVYDNLPSYDVENHLIYTAYTLPDRTPNDGLDDAVFFKPEEKRLPFTLNLPDHWGFGLSWETSSRLLCAADVLLYRSHYLLQGLNFDLPQDDSPEAGSRYRDSDGEDDVRIKNHLALRAGLEYRLAELGKIWLLRAGFYTEPNFGLQAVSRDSNLQREFPDKSGFVHVTSGAGVVLNNKVRFEGSVDICPALGQIGFIGTTVLRL